MKYSLLEVVKLQQDLPGSNLQKGDIGAIVEVYSNPYEAYEVEFCDTKGKTIALLTLKPEQLMPITNRQGAKDDSAMTLTKSPTTNAQTGNEIC